MDIKQSQKDLSDFFNQVFGQQFEAVFHQKKSNEQKEALRFVMEDKDKVIAAVACQRLYQTLKISDLAVAADYQHLGLGTKLLTYLKNYCQENGLTKIILTTRSYQAKDFYLKNDFEIFGHLEDVPFAGVSTYYLVYHIKGDPL